MRDLEETLEWLKSFKKDGDLDLDELYAALTAAIRVIESLKDDAESAWGMLEEQKASEIEAHAASLKKEIDRKIAESLVLVGTKVVDA
jgi:hypothetical protein